MDDTPDPHYFPNLFPFPHTPSSISLDFQSYNYYQSTQLSCCCLAAAFISARDCKPEASSRNAFFCVLTLCLSWWGEGGVV